MIGGVKPASVYRVHLQRHVLHGSISICIHPAIRGRHGTIHILSCQLWWLLETAIGLAHASCHMCMHELPPQSFSRRTTKYMYISVLNLHQHCFQCTIKQIKHATMCSPIRLYVRNIVQWLVWVASSIPVDFAMFWLSVCPNVIGHMNCSQMYTQPIKLQTST